MKVLHVNVAYIVDKFYDVFFGMLDSHGIEQIVYTPFKKRDYKEDEIVRINERIPNISKILMPIKTSKDRIFYFSKIKKYYNVVEREIDNLKDIKLIHAHSLFTDGGVAYKINEKYGIPYIVAVRTADTEKFMRYMKHLKFFMYKIIRNASKIVFINHNIYEKFIGEVKNQEIVNLINEKSEIIPNGVDKYWIDNLSDEPKQIKKDRIRLIHVGKLIRRKNQILTLRVANALKKSGCEVSVDIVGEGRDLEKLMKYVQKKNLCNNVKFHGFIEDKDVLRNLLRNNDIFSLPSHTETFGVAYIEALSQGLPVIYTNGQGIDGYINDKKIGDSVRSNNLNDMLEAVDRITDSYNEISKNCLTSVNQFLWEDIIVKYVQIYKEIENS